MAEEIPKFDTRLKEGVAYFEQMLKVMPDDRTTLEFLAVAYPQLGELDKAEEAVASLARVLLKEGDVESASALLPRLEECEAPSAKAMVLKVRAAISPRPELSPEPPVSVAPTGLVAAAVESEVALAAELGEEGVAEQLRALPANGRIYLVSTLSLLEKEKPEACEKALARLADKYGDVPVPLDAFEPDKGLLQKLPDELVRVRGIVPFARLGELALVVTLSPHDENLKKTVSAALGRTNFYLAEPRLVEVALQKIHPETKEKNA